MSSLIIKLKDPYFQLINKKSCLFKCHTTPVTLSSSAIMEKNIDTENNAMDKSSQLKVTKDKSLLVNPSLKAIIT